MDKDIKWVTNNWDRIPDTFKSFIKPNEYSTDVPGLKLEEHFVVLLLDRQKPSVERGYDFDEERIGVTKTGKIIWGFDSGCSCPSPWDDSYPNCYSVEKEWKQFEVNLKDFDKDWEKEIKEKIADIRKAVK